MGHSMGGVIIHYFMKWVTTPKEEGGGGGGTDWVDKHIESYVNIAGALLGVPKAVAALMSGEMKDTSILLGPVGDIAEQLFGRKMRKDMFATWGALWAMLPKGGDAVWDTVPDGQNDIPMLILTDPNTDIKDDELKDVSDNEIVRKRLMDFASKENHTVSDLVDMLLTWGSGYGPDISAAKFHSFERKEEITRENWHDVTVTPLPDAPTTKIYCLYGVGAETEVGYYYRASWEGREGEDRCSDDKCDPPFLLDHTVNDVESNTIYGVRSGNGDGTVPLISLGYPCVGGWATKELNPGGTKVITREYQDKSVFQVDDPLRGGPEAAIHIDILGNRKMTEDILRIVTGHRLDKVEPRIISEIEEVSKKINAKLF
jgi:phospholipid:diacylglycerol acyltransferase